jgi:hypothetical protein
MTPHEEWIASLVGKRFKAGLNGKAYKCTAADWRDVTLVCEDDAADVHLVSDVAIGRTYHEIHADGGCDLRSPKS